MDGVATLFTFAELPGEVVHIAGEACVNKLAPYVKLSVLRRMAVYLSAMSGRLVSRCSWKRTRLCTCDKQLYPHVPQCSFTRLSERLPLYRTRHGKSLQDNNDMLVCCADNCMLELPLPAAVAGIFASIVCNVTG